MAVYFGPEVIKDQTERTDRAKRNEIEFEFGEVGGHLYIKADGKEVLIDKPTGKRIYDCMMKVGGFLAGNHGNTSRAGREP